MDRVDYQSLLIQDLIASNTDRTLDLNPWYQRRSVWSTPQKAYLINSILEQKPVPSLYIRHQIDIENERSVKEVVDGQQRIRTIISYRLDEFAAKHPSHPRKVLYSELARGEKEAFLATAVSVGYLIGADDRDVIEIFGRINSISKTLNPQEKRNAQYSGEFKQFSLQQAAARVPFWRATSIFSASDISRMVEVQFISDLAINMIEGLQDYSAPKIDRYYKLYDAEFEAALDLTSRMERIFQLLAEMQSELFRDTVFSQYQVAFSLMIVLDSLRDNMPNRDRLAAAMRAIDAQAVAARAAGELMGMELQLVEAFTGGNLHRLAARRKRDEVIRAALR
ncbi:DUF262 domain-containing protein [Sphingomonas sp. 2SG]|uniref:DUF262 domain-containing protein n=1 Tax=Sphingomonas sp. 2SG TaxID=2502201 RepID=UPI0010F9EC2E|nr:DUF262 domain-containing protein [Sphingomonas sp. 2SG]